MTQMVWNTEWRISWVKLNLSLMFHPILLLCQFQNESSGWSKVLWGLQMRLAEERILLLVSAFGFQVWDVGLFPLGWLWVGALGGESLAPWLLLLLLQFAVLFSKQAEVIVC